MYACGITVYDLCHVGPRAHDGRVRRHRPPPARQRLRASASSATSPTSTTRSSARRTTRGSTAAEVSRSASPTRCNDDMRALGVAAARRRAARDRAHRRDDRDHRAAGREAARPTRPDGDVYYAVAGLRRLRQALRAELDDLQAGARIEVDEQKTQPARLRAVEGGQAGRAVVGQPVGRGPAGLAHRVLGDVARATSASRSTSTAAATT